MNTDELRSLLSEEKSAIETGELESLISGAAAAPLPIDQNRLLKIFGAIKSDPAKQAIIKLINRRRDAFTEEIAGARTAGDTRLNDLRAELEQRGLTGFLQPVADEHLGEYVPLRGRRLPWLTGFSGSAGLVIVLQDRAAVFVDGRYVLQVTQQVDTEFFETHHTADKTPRAWLADVLTEEDRLGYDPWLHTETALKEYRAVCKKAGAELIAAKGNPIDAIWADQPPPPLSQMEVHSDRFSGETSNAKRTRLAEDLQSASIDAAVLTAPDSIAWLLNVRGSDVPRTPFSLSFAILSADASVDLFIDERKVDDDVAIHLGNSVRRHSPAEFEDALKGLGTAGKTVAVDPSSAAAWITETLESADADVRRQTDPCQLPKAIKNKVELAGMRAAHRRDGAALTEFLGWIAEAAIGGEETEISASDHLQDLRTRREQFRDLSFDTISGAGANGAIVHYKASAETDAQVKAGSLYLVDSGAQYLDGTTDVTRTVAIGDVGDEEKDRFTRVLKGHIALASAKFPKGTSGPQLDTLARHALWQAGLDYDHGTGHGVGSFLSVHEGPHGISKRAGDVALVPGMIVSNEPGYYKAGAYGIRIENLIAVIECEDIAGAEREMLGFETLTMAPIDRNLIKTEMLSADEIAWLDEYHASVLEIVGPQVDAKTAAWLKKAAAPL